MGYLTDNFSNPLYLLYIGSSFENDEEKFDSTIEPNLESAIRRSAPVFISDKANESIVFKKWY